MEGKKWTFMEFKAYLEEEGIEKGKGVTAEKTDKTVPSHWPPDLEVDTKRHPWVPADWGQGLRTSSISGKNRAVFVSPEGKIFHNRRDVEKACGRTFEDVKVPEAPKKKDQADRPEAPPQSYWPEWLPLDWIMSSRISSGSTRPYYFSPSGRGFFNRGAAEEYIQKNPSATLVKPTAAVSTPLAGSRPRSRPGDFAEGGRPKRKEGEAMTPAEAGVSSSPTKADSKSGSAHAGVEDSPSAKDSPTAKDSSTACKGQLHCHCQGQLHCQG